MTATKGRSEVKDVVLPIDGRIVATEPRNAEDEVVFGHASYVQWNGFGMETDGDGRLDVAVD